MNISPILPRHPLDHPGIKVALGHLASDAIKTIGDHCLVIVTQADGTAPDAARGRMILHCIPCSRDALDAAYRVASGKARAVRIKTTPPPSPALTRKELRGA